MSGSNDGSGKGPTKPTPDTAGPKKPSAIIDLKATEVKPPEAKPATSASAAASDTKKPEPVAAKPSESKPAATAAATAASSATKTDAKPSAASSATASSSAKAAPATTAAPPARSGGGIASVATHLFAGVAGGFLALLGADSIAPQLGLSSPGAGLTEMQRRLSAMEDAAKAKPSSPSPELAQKLAATEARLAKIEETARTLPSLS